MFTDEELKTVGQQGNSLRNTLIIDISYFSQTHNSRTEKTLLKVYKICISLSLTLCIDQTILVLLVNSISHILQ